MDDDKLAAPNRHKHFDDASGRLLYEWEQTLDEVNVFVPTDASAHKTKDLNVSVTGNAIEITTTKKKLENKTRNFQFRVGKMLNNAKF